MDQTSESASLAAVDLDTPAVTILLDRLEDNIARVQRMVAASGKQNRPHVKTHKIPAIGAMQVAAGASGLTCQKLGEAEVFIDAGVTDDILISFNIVGPQKTGRLMDLSERIGRLAVVADNDTVLEGLSQAARARGRTVPVLIECDGGFGRNGVQTRKPRSIWRGSPDGSAGSPSRGSRSSPTRRRARWNSSRALWSCSRRPAFPFPCCRAAARRRC